MFKRAESWENEPMELEPACEVCRDTGKVDGEPCTDCPHCLYCGDRLAVGNHRNCWRIDE
jgi:MoaA/NifB/PqqE/SkfB family radical SAM enzyme